VTSRYGMSLPERASAWRAAMAMPPQQGTTIFTTVTLLMVPRVRIWANLAM